MKWTDLLILSLQNLWRRKLRTILTVVGVMIGTTSVVIMVSIGLGANKQFEDNIQNSERLTLIEVSDPAAWDSAAKQKSKVRLDDQFLNRVANIDHVVFTTPVMRVYGNGLSLKQRKYVSDWVPLTGLSSEAFEVLVPFMDGVAPDSSSLKPLQIAMGSQNMTDFRKENSYQYTGIAPDIDWLNAKFALNITSFNNNGEAANVKKYDADIVGISGYDQSVSYNWSGYEDGYFVQIDALKRLMKENPKAFSNAVTDGYETAYIKVDDFKYVTQVLKELKEGNTLQFYAEMEYIESNRKQATSLQLMLGGIGGIVMLVAAISIANTMLMSIYERTREIGVMKVLGCKLSNISMLFLSEAALIGLFGGAIGIGLSYGLSALLNFIFGYYSYGGGMQSYIPIWLSILSLLFSVVVGIVSGLYPSQRAMRLSALAAIRNDV